MLLLGLLIAGAAILVLVYANIGNFCKK
jgi:hypothetical protein